MCSGSVSTLPWPMKSFRNTTRVPVKQGALVTEKSGQLGAFLKQNHSRGVNHLSFIFNLEGGGLLEKKDWAGLEYGESRTGGLRSGRDKADHRPGGY